VEKVTAFASLAQRRSHRLRLPFLEAPLARIRPLKLPPGSPISPWAVCVSLLPPSRHLKESLTAHHILCHL
jgi:hypothetical protein